MSEKTTAKLVASAPSVSEAVAPVLPEKVIKLSQVFKKAMTVSDTGVIELPKDIYETTLPEGLTMDIIKLGQSHNTDVVAALAYATGLMGESFLKKHKDVTEVSAEFKAGKDLVGSVYSREKTVTIPGDPVTHKTKYGVSKSFYEAHAAGANRGALKKVRDLLSAQAEAASKS